MRKQSVIDKRNWLVYYRVVENTVYIRGLWPVPDPNSLICPRQACQIIPLETPPTKLL